MYGYYAGYEDAECFARPVYEEYDEDRAFEEKRERELFDDMDDYE